MTILYTILYLLTPTTNATLVQPAEVLILDANMQAFVDTVVTERDPVRRLRQLVEAVFSEDFLNLQYDNTYTKTAPETFATRNGNCLSFTMMFVAMARYAGLDARFQEVFIMPTWNRKGDIVMLSRHINVAVVVGARSFEIDFNPFQEHRQMSKRTVIDDRAIAQYYNNRGVEYFAKGVRETALVNMEAAVQIAPDLSFAWSNLGVMYRHLNRYQDAENAYLKALEIDRQEFTAMANLAKLYDVLARPRDAERYRKQAERFRKRNPYYHYSLGEQSLAKKDYETAVEHYRRAIRRKKEEHRFHFALAKTYAFMNDIEQAAKYLEKARGYAPDVFNANRYAQKLSHLSDGK